MTGNKLIWLLLLLLACSSCRQTAPLNGKLTSDKLPSQLITISTSRDNTIRLSGGTMIQIPANALKNANGDSVKLEIKEALTTEQMIVAGLYTRSNGELLASGGMLYIAPQQGQNVKILKPLKVIVPASQVQQGMQLFKGEIVDSAINWVDPAPLEVSKNDTNISNGKILFQNNCVQCHGITKKTVGPPLFGAIQRWKNDTAAVYEFTRNIAAALHKYPRANCVYNQYRIGMPSYPSLTKEELDNIYLYIQEAGMKELGSMPAEYAIDKRCDSCDYILLLRDSLNNMNKSAYSDSSTNVPAPILTTNATPAIINSIVLPNAYYSFDISAFGWFNIDMYLSLNPQAEDAKLRVMQEGVASPDLFPVLVIPALKIIQSGHFSSNGDYFCFFKDEDGKIKLPSHQQAYIFVVGDKGEQVLFGLTNFVTGGDQTIRINIQKSSKEAVAAGIRGLKSPDLKINIRKSENIEIDRLKLEQELETLNKANPCFYDNVK